MKKTVIPFLVILIGISFQGIGQVNKPSDSIPNTATETAAQATIQEY